MRNPNGYGGVVKLSGKRRKPYMARVTDGWEVLDNGKRKQVYKPVGYFKRRTDALTALDAYHNQEPTLGMTNLTFGQVYDLWSTWKYDPNNPTPIAESNIKGYKASYKICDAIKDMKMSDIKAAHLQSVVANSGKNEPILKKFKTMLSQMYQYAMANDIVDKDYSSYITIQKSPPVIDRIPFTEDEIKLLWDNLGKNEWIDTVLIQIYTGMRITELLEIKNTNVFLNDKYMIGGIKTEAGTDRKIPLHDRIVPLIQNRYNANNNLLVLYKGGALSYKDYRYHWDNLMYDLFIKHLPHDCRHTFKTLAKKYKMDDFWVSRIMGHKAENKMDDIYSHSDIELMKIEVNKLP